MNEMQLAQMVRKILAEELEKLNGREKHALLNGRKAKVLFLVPDDFFSFGVFYNHIQQEYQEFQIHIAANDAHRLYAGYQSSNTKYIDVLDAEERALLFAKLLGYERVVVLMNGLKVAKSILAMEDACFVSQIVFYALSQNQAVCGLWSFSNESSVSKTIRTMQKRLEVMGMKSINIQDFDQEVKDVLKKSEGVITEQMVLQAHARGQREIEAWQRQLVTPLAKDRARELGILISRFKG